MKRIGWLLGIVALLLGMSTGAGAAPYQPLTVPKTLAPVTTVDNTPQKLPVLWVHGYENMLNGCGGVRADRAANTMAPMLTALGYTGRNLGVAYYCSDNGSLDIRGQATGVPAYYGNNITIEQIGRDLAWAVWRVYSSQGQYVNLVGHSMGGLVIHEALTHEGEDGYPPHLLVRHVLTYSTPYAGSDRAPKTASWCGTTAQCNELAPGSAFVTALLARSLPADVDWTAVGGGAVDNVCTFTACADAIAAQHKLDYYAPAPFKYSHTSYTMDPSTANDEPYRSTDAGTTRTLVGYHATYQGARILAETQDVVPAG